MKRHIVCLLLGIVCAPAVSALGLGDVSVRSHIGQPLHAVVKLIDAPSSLAADCFRVAPAEHGPAALEGAQWHIEQSGSETRIHVRTARAFNEPFAQFILMADCDVRMQREYVLLLDPPTLAPAIEPVTAPVSSPAAAPPASSPRRNARPAPTDRSRPAPARTQAPASDRLVLSGQRSPVAAAPSRFALKLDLDLPNPDRIGTAPALTETELSDENTALTRKMAHLEAQLAELHQRNAQLEIEQAARQPKLEPAAPERPRWPLALLLMGLLLAVILLMFWLRRRNRKAAIHTAPFPASLVTAPREPDFTPAPDAMEGAVAPRLHLDDLPATQTGAGTEVKEDILDQAEVFMAHGHGDFATHLLQEHLRANPTESPVPWLLLLDLLHRAGDTEGYAAASLECRRHFNINLSGHPISQDGSEPGPGLEAYPHLLEKIITVWDTPELDAFFHDLIYDDRGGTRAGFEPGAYRDILLLRDIAQSSLPSAA